MTVPAPSLSLPYSTPVRHESSPALDLRSSQPRAAVSRRRLDESMAELPAKKLRRMGMPCSKRPTRHHRPVLNTVSTTRRRLLRKPCSERRDNFLRGETGATVLMVPGLPDHVSKGAVGVRRISLATSPYRAAIDAIVTAADAVRDHGTFEFVETGLPTPRLAS